jgi:hypothetical protein
VTDQRDPTVSATVLLRRLRGGDRPSGGSESPRGAGEAIRFFTAVGFEVGPYVAGTFSITGRRSLFERTFDERLRQEEAGGHRTARGSLELDLQALPEDVARDIEAVAFSRPPDFGPSSF